MQITVLFTYSNLIGSKAIRAVTKETVSHCAILHEGTKVTQASALHNTVEIISFKDFIQAGNKILYKVDLEVDRNEFYAAMLKCVDKPYDFGAIAYLGLRYVFNFLPKKNLWNSTGMFLCTELVENLIKFPKDDMLTPFQLYMRLLNRPTASSNKAKFKLKTASK